MEVSQHSKFFCEFCGKYAVKKKDVGIWGYKDCRKVKAGEGLPFLNKRKY
ncbi:putative ribosomal protein L37ae [Helianthus debilis subsp. tardiflorus]